MGVAGRSDRAGSSAQFSALTWRTQVARLVSVSALNPLNSATSGLNVSTPTRWISGWVSVATVASVLHAARPPVIAATVRSCPARSFIIASIASGARLHRRGADNCAIAWRSPDEVPGGARGAVNRGLRPARWLLLTRQNSHHTSAGVGR
jgi:hypothetical protein